MRYPLPKFQLKIDVIFIGALVVLHAILRQCFAGIRPEIGDLFFASYLLVGLGAFILYLVFSLNPKLALNLHAGVFPLLALLYLFLRWIPEVIGSDGPLPAGVDAQIFSGVLLVYILLLFAFFLVQFIVRARGFERPIE